MAWSFVLSVGLFSVAAALWQRPNLDTDAGTCLLAAEQYLVGRSDRFHQLVDVDPGSIESDRIRPITWWPRSYSLPTLLGKQLGLDLGRSLQLSFLFFWSVGILGWTLLFRRMISAQLLPWLVLALLLFRYCHAAGYLYEGGELMYWSLFPAVLLLNLSALERRQGTVQLVIAAGLVTPCLVLLKYSAGISLLAIGSCWLLMARLGQVTIKQLGCWTAAAAVASGVILLGGQLPHGNPATSSGQWQWATLLWSPGGWTFAMSDLESLVRYLAVQPGRMILPAIGHYQDGQVALVSPLTLGVVAWLILRTRPENNSGPVAAGKLASTVVVVHLLIFTLLLTGLILTGGAIHMDSRLLRPASLAVLPLLVMRASRAMESSNKLTQAAGLSFLLLLVVIPASYGAATLVDKSLLRSRYASNQTGPAGIRHDLLDRDGDALKFYRQIEFVAGESTVIYMIDPGLALPLASNRLLIEHAHLRSVQHLAAKQYGGCPTDGVLLVVPREFEVNGKLAAIQNSFKDVADWAEVSCDSQPGWIIRHGHGNH
jgi:hypothetical protein